MIRALSSALLDIPDSFGIKVFPRLCLGISNIRDHKLRKRSSSSPLAIRICNFSVAINFLKNYKEQPGKTIKTVA